MIGASRYIEWASSGPNQLAVAEVPFESALHMIPSTGTDEGLLRAELAERDDIATIKDSLIAIFRHQPSVTGRICKICLELSWMSSPRQQTCLKSNNERSCWDLRDQTGFNVRGGSYIRNKID